MFSCWESTKLTSAQLCVWLPGLEDTPTGPLRPAVHSLPASCTSLSPRTGPLSQLPAASSKSVSAHA